MKDWSPTYVQKVHTILQTNSRANDSCLIAPSIPCPFPSPCRGVLEEVYSITEPVVLIAADPKAVAQDRDCRVASSPVVTVDTKRWHRHATTSGSTIYKAGRDRPCRIPN